MEAKHLELFYSDGGYPGKKVTGMMDMGQYDVSVGKEFEFYIRNPLHNTRLDISDLHLDVSNPDISFNVKDEIMPFETVKATIKIAKKELEEFDVMTTEGLRGYTDFIKELQEDMKKPSETIGSLKGKIIPYEINVIRDDKQTTYGW